MHDGLRYACDKYDYQATQTGTLKQHIRSLHGGIHQFCDFYDYKTFCPKRMKQHQKRKHTTNTDI